MPTNDIVQKRSLLIQQARGISLPAKAGKPLHEAVIASGAKVDDNYGVIELVKLAKQISEGIISPNDFKRFHNKVYELEKECFGDDVEPKRYLLSYVMETANGTYFSDSENLSVRYVKPVIVYRKQSNKTTSELFIPVAYSSADAVLSFQEGRKESSFLFIGYVGVKEEFRGLGLGRLALEQVVAEARGIGIQPGKFAILEIDLPLDDVGRSSLYCGERAKFRVPGVILADGEKRILRMQRPGMGETEELPPTPIILGTGVIGSTILEELAPDKEIENIKQFIQTLRSTVRGFYGLYDYWYGEVQGKQISELQAEALASIKEIEKLTKRVNVRLALLDVGHFKDVDNPERIYV
ncbi:MAG: GNAT family N-acetyltransferase [Candidatus Micrarchaeota archaeon]|nr:GNAT family N-acetyltransferase [Candidatus Micrarchaeota archaeon]